MSTWKTVFTLEWRILRRDRAAVGILGIFAVFLILSALAGGRHADALSDGLAASQAAEQAHLERLGDELSTLISQGADPRARDPRDPMWMGQEGAPRMAILPPAPLAPLAVGQRDLQPQAIRVSSKVHLEGEFNSETSMSGPARLTTGAFDPAFLFVILFPLIVIALSYELLSAERERGTLAMLLSQPISQGALVLGKAGARAVALCAVTLAFALVGLLVAGAPLGAPGAWLHVLLYGLVLVAWAIFWFSAAIFVNSRGGTSARNALTLVGMWLTLVIVVPGLVGVAVDLLYPPPSRLEQIHEAREDNRDLEQKRTALLGRHDVDPDMSKVAVELVEVEEELAAREAPAHAAEQEHLQRRSALIGALRFVTPALLVQLALEDLAGSGQTRHQRFDEQVDDYHQRLRAHHVALIRAGATMTPKAMDATPTFHFQEEPLAGLLGRVLTGVLGLLLAAAALLAMARAGLGRIGRLAS